MRDFSDIEKRLMVICNNLYTTTSDMVENRDEFDKYLENELGVTSHEINMIQDALSIMPGPVPNSLTMPNSLVEFDNTVDILKSRNVLLEDKKTGKKLIAAISILNKIPVSMATKHDFTESVLDGNFEVYLADIIKTRYLYSGQYRVVNYHYITNLYNDNIDIEYYKMEITHNSHYQNASNMIPPI